MSSFQFKILNIFLLLIIFNFPQVQAQEKNIIIKDNWDQTTDKLAPPLLLLVCITLSDTLNFLNLKPLSLLILLDFLTRFTKLMIKRN